MKRAIVSTVLFASILAVTPARAGEKCPLDIQSCLNAFAHMRERPWLGVEFDTDSLGDRHVLRVVEGSPAEKAGIQPGDVLRKVDGQPIQQWFSGRSGWTMGAKVSCVVERNHHDQKLSLAMQPIPEELLDRLIGAHMLENHLADAGTNPPDRH